MGKGDVAFLRLFGLNREGMTIRWRHGCPATEPNRSNTKDRIVERNLSPLPPNTTWTIVKPDVDAALRRFEFPLDERGC